MIRRRACNVISFPTRCARNPGRARTLLIRFLFSGLTVILLIAQFNTLYANQKLKQQILAAIASGATYASEVLLDEEGKSRCDYNLLEGRWYPYEEPWHTGQIIYALLEAEQVTGNAKFLVAARRAGDWWVSLEIKDHPKLKGMVRAIHGDGLDFIVFATVSDGSAGLFRLYEATGDKRYADVPARAGEWMLQHMYVPEKGVFYDCVDPTTGEVLKENSPFWPDKKQQELYDVSRPNNEGSIFKDIYEYTKNDKYKNVFVELCESLVEKQGPGGLWMDFTPNNKEDGSIHPRFNLWYAESLLEGYELTGDRRYLEAALKTARCYQTLQQKDGTFYYQNFLDGTSNKNSISGSTVAFAGIVWLRLLKYGVGEEFRPSIDKSLKWTLTNRYSVDHPDQNLAGGFTELRTRSKNGKIWITHRDVGTSFSLRFLCDYYRMFFATEMQK